MNSLFKRRASIRAWVKLGSKGSPDEAIAQIKEKNYAGKYASCGKPIMLIGANFDERKRTIKEWKAVGI
ncbi:PD-(D/E)XK nuclease domain-containing protein [Treponema denticola]|uniref:PD-(D/E)XK nuclease domain-containing protein n=1 Tax=Treponema denticola TaxID=158 RepID=UPI0021FC3366|nr:PD-(D/E)XK nuclease domain-containing protein [Treponema denticola]